MKNKKNYLIQKYFNILINKNIYEKKLSELLYKNNLDIFFTEYIQKLYSENKNQHSFIFEYFCEYLSENKFYKNLFKNKNYKNKIFKNILFLYLQKNNNNCKIYFCEYYKKNKIINKIIDTEIFINFENFINKSARPPCG